MLQIKDEDVTWILGSSRSGSTWLLRMLAEHPRVVAVNETHIGHHLGVWRPISLAWATSTSPPPLTTLIEQMADRDDYVFADTRRHIWVPALRNLVLDTLTASVRRMANDCDGALPHIVVKEPSGSEVAALLMEMMPHSRLIFLVRDGRDVVTSWLAAYRPGGWILDEGGYSLAPRGRTAFIAWQADVWQYRTKAVQEVFDNTAPERRLLVRYEDLRNDPHHAVAEVFDFLDGNYAPADLMRAVETHAFAKVPANERGEGAHIRSALPGAWRRELDDDEQRLVTEKLSVTLSRYGYR